MEFTVSKLNIVVDNKKAYAFCDKKGYCILIAYGDNNVKFWERYLNEYD